MPCKFFQVNKQSKPFPSSWNLLLALLLTEGTKFTGKKIKTVVPLQFIVNVYSREALTILKLIWDDIGIFYGEVNHFGLWYVKSYLICIEKTFSSSSADFR